MSNWKTNSVTGQLETNFNAPVISIGENWLENSNGVRYKIASIKLPNGNIRSARVYEKNLEYGITVGNSYLCTATQYQNNSGQIEIDLKVSHLVGAERATLDDFGVTPSVVTNNALAEQAV